MSSQALASNNPSRSSSEKERALVCRKEIAELIQRADFSQETEALVRKNVDGKLQLVPCRRTYRRRHLNRALLGVWEGSDRPYGKNEIRCFAHLDKYAAHAHACERTMRYNLRVLDDSDPENGLGVLEEKAKANSIRRPTTYELNVEKLRHFTVLPFRRKNPNSKPRRKSSHSSSPPEASPSVQPAARPQPSPAAPARESHRHIGTRQSERERKLRLEFAVKVAELIQGCDSYVEAHSGIKIPLHPGNRGFRFPLPREKAILRACQEMGLTEAQGRELREFGPEDEPEERR